MQIVRASGGGCAVIWRQSGTALGSESLRARTRYSQRTGAGLPVQVYGTSPGVSSSISGTLGATESADISGLTALAGIGAILAAVERADVSSLFASVPATVAAPQTTKGGGSSPYNVALVNNGAPTSTFNYYKSPTSLTPVIVDQTTGTPYYLNSSGAYVPMMPASLLPTSASGGFGYLPTCAGSPTGTPSTAPTGGVPAVIDTTNSKLWVYIGGAWTAAALT